MTMLRALLLFSLLGTTAYGADDGWKNPLVYKGKLDSPLVEVTPFVFQDRFYLLENWQKQWEFPGTPDGEMFERDEIRIRDMASGEIVAMPLIGHGLGMALADGERVYVFGSDWGTEKKWEVRQISMTSSADLTTWTEPVVVLEAQPDEKFFNCSVTKAGDRYVMLVETNDPRWPAFTFKYFESTNLTDWTQIPEAYYGTEKYVGGPALYFEGGLFYTLYLQSLGDRFYETRVTRSADLVHWEDAPDGRPFVTYNPENKVHELMPPDVRERNASDAELCYVDGKTLVYFTGGNQQLAGDLQWAEYDGTPQALLESFYAAPETVVPTAAQLRYQENQLGCFVHYGPAAYIDGDGGDYLNAPPADLFDPAELDVDQWMEAAKAIGAKHIVLTAKHHNGYCLWPTATTDYSIVQSPWKDGKGDVVREFVDAARRHGISPGLYLSSGDEHFGAKSTPEPRGVRKHVGDVDAYFPVFMAQLTELLTNYGELEVVWFDGAYNPFEPDVRDKNGDAVGTRYTAVIAEAVRRLQPNAVLMGTHDADMRWSGSEQGHAPYPLWNVLTAEQSFEAWLPEGISGWFIPEANIHTRAKWFWAPNTDETLKTPARLEEAYLTSIGHGANLLVNLTPDRSGRIPEAEMAMLQGAGEVIRARYEKPVSLMAEGARWSEGHTLRLAIPEGAEVDTVVIEEDLKSGQRIRAYRIEGLFDGKWKTLAEGESIGRKRIHVFEPVQTAALRLKITDTIPMPRVRTFAAY